MSAALGRGCTGYGHRDKAAGFFLRKVFCQYDESSGAQVFVSVEGEGGKNGAAILQIQYDECGQIDRTDPGLPTIMKSVGKILTLVPARWTIDRNRRDYVRKSGLQRDASAVGRRYQHFGTLHGGENQAKDRLRADRRMSIFEKTSHYRSWWKLWTALTCGFGLRTEKRFSEQSCLKRGLIIC